MVKRKKHQKKAEYSSIFVYDISNDIRTTAILGEIYNENRKYRHAQRQYKRVKYLSNNLQVQRWKDNRLSELRESK